MKFVNVNMLSADTAPVVSRGIKRSIVYTSIFLMMYMQPQQVFADLIATCFDSQSNFVKCRGNSDISSILLSRGKLPSNPPMHQVSSGVNMTLTPLEAKFLIMSKVHASLSTALYFECIVPSNSPLFPSVETIISSSSPGLEYENSYYTSNSLSIKRNGSECVDIVYQKSLK